jgi:RNA polymerase sigma-70 factor, ECF subfamily
VRSSDVDGSTDGLAPGEGQPALERPRPAVRADEAELAAIYEARRGEVFGFLLRMTHDADEADDLVQETFIKLVREARAGRMPDDVRPWLYRVAANAAISRKRRFATFGRLVPRLLDRGEPERPEGEVVRHERDAEVRAVLDRLHPEARAALLMAAQGFSGHEIAEALRKSDGATRTLMCRARVELRRMLAATEAGS